MYLHCDVRLPSSSEQRQGLT